MAGTKLDSRQSVNRSALIMVGSVANDSLDTIFPKIDAELAKLFEDRNITLVDGGIIAFPVAGTSVTFTTNLKLHINSRVAGGTPVVIDLLATTRILSANLKMVYAAINRTAGTATITDDSSTLPTQTSANQEIVLIAKRVDSTDGTVRVYFRGGFSLSAGQSARIGQTGTHFSSEFSVVDFTDTTKKILMQVSGSATGTSLTLAAATTVNRVITFPDVTDTVVTLAASQSLTSKKISYSVSTDSTTTGSAATLQSFNTGVIRLTNASLTTVSGIPAGNTGQSLVVENQTGATITVLDNDSGATTANRIRTGTGAGVTMNNNATFTFTYDATASLWMLTGGSASASTGSTINYIANPNAEAGTLGWSTYANAAGAVPVTGIGGVPAVTFTRSVTNPLRGLGSFLLTKDAVNRQGQGASYDFTIDSADKAKILQVTFDYIIDSGTFVAGSQGVDSDVEVYLYDVTNAVIIQPSTYKLFSNSSLNPNRFIGSFQTSSNSTSYRLIFHVATVSALAYALKFDNVFVSPTQYATGTVITDWVIYAPTFSGFGVVSSISARYRRAGSSLEIDARFSSTSNTATEARMFFPAGLVSDSSIATYEIAGSGGLSFNGGAFLGFNPLRQPSVNYLTFGVQYSGGGFSSIDPALANTFNPGLFFSLKAAIPIQGWAVQQQTSDVNDQRIVAAQYMVDTSSPQWSLTQPLNYNVKLFDTHSAVTPSATAWKFTAPIHGFYRVSITTLNAANSAVYLYKNGVEYGLITNQIAANGSDSGSISVELTAGDYIDLRNATTTNASATPRTNTVSIEKIANPAQISATETIAASYYMSAPSGPTANQPVNYDSKVVDTHSAVTTGVGLWRFTAPASGIYEFSIKAWTSSASSSLRIAINGTRLAAIPYILRAGSVQDSLTFFYRLNAGDYFYTVADGSGSINFDTALPNLVAIKRIGI